MEILQHKALLRETEEEMVTLARIQQEGVVVVQLIPVQTQ